MKLVIHDNDAIPVNEILQVATIYKIGCCENLCTTNIHIISKIAKIPPQRGIKF